MVMCARPRKSFEILSSQLRGLWTLSLALISYTHTAFYLFGQEKDHRSRKAATHSTTILVGVRQWWQSQYAFQYLDSEWYVSRSEPEHFIDHRCFSIIHFISFRLLLLPGFPETRYIKPTQFRLGHNSPGLALDGGIDHFPVHRPRALALLLGALLRNDNPHRPLDFLVTRAEDLLHAVHLARMNALLAIVPHSFPLLGLPQQGLMVGLALETRRDQVDRAGQVVRARGGRDGLPGIQEFCEGGRARDAHVQRVILRGKDEALQQARRGAADLVELQNGFCALDQRQHTDRAALFSGPFLLLCARVFENIPDEGEIVGAFDLGNDQRGQVARLHHLFQIGERETAADAVDAHRALLDARGHVLVQRATDGGAGFGFATGRDAVFEVVGDAVGRHAAGLVKEGLRGAGHYTPEKSGQHVSYISSDCRNDVEGE